MHTTALHNCRLFFDCYGESIRRNNPNAGVVEIGSLDVNGSLRSVCPAGFGYTGVDFVAGKGVDLVLEDPYLLPFEAQSVDVVLSSSCFEHSEMFWLAFLEIMRVLKPEGLFYLNVPSNGSFHRYPVDCWRFYPDSGRALILWAKRNGMKPALLESYISSQMVGQWNDFVAIFAKDESKAHLFPDRIVYSKEDFSNGLVHGQNDFIKFSELPEDRKKQLVINQVIQGKLNLGKKLDDTEKLGIIEKIILNTLSVS